MRHLFVARHGNYAGSRLNDYGIKQMEILGDSIKDTLNGQSAYLISSTAPRAVHSAEILTARLGLPAEFEKFGRLWSGSDAPYETGNPTDDPLEVMEILGNVEERTD